jgi:hypothetical protein
MEIHMRELSAEARLHLYARSLRRSGAGLQLAAFSSAFAVIAAVVFGTLSVHPFQLGRMLMKFGGLAH